MRKSGIVLIIVIAIVAHGGIVFAAPKTPRQQYKGFVLQEKGKKDEVWFVDPRTLKRSCFRDTEDVRAILQLLGVRRAAVSKKILAAILVARACPKPKVIIMPSVETPSVIKLPDAPSQQSTQPTSQTPEVSKVDPPQSSIKTVPVVTLSSNAQDFVDRLNVRRRNLTISEVMVHPILSSVAQQQAERNDISMDQNVIENSFSTEGYQWSGWSGFVAQGYTEAQRVLDRWVEARTPAAIDNPRFADVGVGYVSGNSMQGPTWIIFIAESAAHRLQGIAAVLGDRIAQVNAVLAYTNAARAACTSPNDHPLPRPSTDCPDTPQPECSQPLQPLTLNALLSKAAQGHADDMSARQYHAHFTPEGLTFVDRIQRAGYQGVLMGENLACGPDTPKRVVEGWLTSCGHRENILSSEWRELGVGLAVAPEPFVPSVDKPKGPCTPLVYWVQNFGQPK